VPFGFHVLNLLPGAAFGHARSGRVNSLNRQALGISPPMGGRGPAAIRDASSHSALTRTK
jgi:hypothetical protein